MQRIVDLSIFFSPGFCFFAIIKFVWWISMFGVVLAVALTLYWLLITFLFLVPVKLC